MPSRLPIQTLVPALLMLSIMPTAKAQDTQTGQDVEEPAVVAKDLAALMAFRQLIGSRRYVVSADQLAGMVKKHLQESKAKPPLALPALADLQTSGLKRDFQARYDEMLKKATSKLDPGGKLKLEERLRKYLKEHPGLRTKAESRYQEYAKKELPAALGRVNKTLVAQQVKQLNGRLEKYLGSGKPAVEDVQSAFKNNAQSSLSRLIKKEVLDDVKLALPRLLPADEAFGKSVDKVASDSVGQLKEQSDALEKAPEAHTLKGIDKEMQARLVDKANSQETAREKDPLRKAYGVFPLVKGKVGQKAEDHFGRRVEAATQRVIDAVKSGKQPIPEKHEQRIHDETVGDLRKHHQLNKSKGELTGTVKGMVDEDWKWVTDVLKESAENSPSPHDSDYSRAQLDKDVAGLLANENTIALKSRNAFGDLLTKEYEQKLIPKVRKKIADQQAEKYWGRLARGKWRPTETQVFGLFDDLAEQKILGLDNPLQRQDLRVLNVWPNAGPAQDDDVLEEAWQQWVDSANYAFAIWQRAVIGQEREVRKAKSYMFPRIRKDPDKGKPYWVNEYVSHVSAKWRDGPDPAKRDYPLPLFDTTRKKIDRLLDPLFEEIEQKRIEEEKKKKEEAEKPAAPETTKTEPPAESEPQAQPPAQKGPPSDGQSPGEGWPLGSGTAGPSGDRVSPNDEEDEAAEIPKAQRRIVYQLEPVIRAEVKKSPLSERTLNTQYWKDEYVRRATATWKKDTRSGDYPDLLPPVVSRIDELVGEILAEIIIGKVRVRQKEMVEQHRAGTNGKESIIKLIKGDPDATYRKYRRLFVNRVSDQWQNDGSPEIALLRKTHPRLLESVERLISGIVVEALSAKERLAATDGSDGFGEGDSPTGFYFKFYQIGFWTMCFLVLVMAGCWYWNVKYLRAYIAAQRRLRE